MILVATTDPVRIGYQLAEVGPTRLYLQDMLGRTVGLIRDETMKSGVYHERVGISKLTNGSYRVVLESPTEIRSKRVQVIK